VRRRIVPLVGFAYLLLFGAVMFGWLALRAAGLLSGTERLSVALVCIAPALVHAAIAALWRGERTLLLRSAAIVLLGPIVLLAWGSSVVGPPGGGESHGGLDFDSLFRGAEKRGESPKGAPGPAFASGGFADGTELRVMRLEDAAAAAEVFAFVIASRKGQPRSLGERSGVQLDPTARAGVFVYMERHGRDLLEARAPDEPTLLARLTEQHTPLPTEPAFEAATRRAQGTRVEPFLVAYGLGQLLAFFAFVSWARARMRALPAGARAPLPERDVGP
jgi:hypothetical protein